MRRNGISGVSVEKSVGDVLWHATQWLSVRLNREMEDKVKLTKLGLPRPRPGDAAGSGP